MSAFRSEHIVTASWNSTEITVSADSSVSDLVALSFWSQGFNAASTMTAESARNIAEALVSAANAIEKAGAE